MANNFKKLEDAAFPLNLTDKNGIWQNGMSMRFYAACAAMQGILANNGKSGNPNIEDNYRYYSNIVKHSYMAADELLKQEHDEKEDQQQPIQH